MNIVAYWLSLGYLGNTPGREGGCGINSIKSHTVDSDTTCKTSLSQVLTISCEQIIKQTGHNLLNSNISGIKEARGSRKRKSSRILRRLEQMARTTTRKTIKVTMVQWQKKAFWSG